VQAQPARLLPSFWELVVLARTLNPASMRLFETVIEVADSPR
jgi:hypothetical protein